MSGQEHHPRYPAVVKTKEITDTMAVEKTRTIISPMAYGYWINAMPFRPDSEIPDIVSFGLGIKGGPSTIGYFTNPLNNESKTEKWAITPIQSLLYSTGMGWGDFRGPDVNLHDIIIVDHHGPTIWGLLDSKTEQGGRIRRLVNPGKRMGAPFWEIQEVGNITGMHRLQIGRFTRQDVNQVLAAPVIAASGDLELGVPLPLFTPTYGAKFSDGPTGWTRQETISDFHIIHDVQIVPRYNNGLDTVLFASREGVAHLWYDLASQGWQATILGLGMPKEMGTPQFWGSMTVDYARIGDDPMGYIISAEAYHGNTVAIYTKGDDAPKGFASLLDGQWWTRHVIDAFGAVDDVLQTGTIHHVRRIWIDTKDGTAPDVEPFTVACTGEPIGKSENQGVFLYTPIDIKTATFKKTRVHTESAARMALGEFNGKGETSLASVTYYVPGYHVGPDPAQVRISVMGKTGIVP